MFDLYIWTYLCHVFFFFFIPFRLSTSFPTLTVTQFKVKKVFFGHQLPQWLCQYSSYSFEAKFLRFEL